MKEEKKHIPGNYYGTPYVYQEEGKYLFGIENYFGQDEVEVSKDFYDAFVKEFNTQ